MSRRGDPKGAIPYANRMRDALREVDARRIPAAYRYLLLTLATYARPDGSRCYPAIDTLRADTGIGRRKLYVMLRELEAAGWLKREHRTDPETGRQTSSTYTMYLSGSPIRTTRRTVRGLLPVPTLPADPQIKH